MSSLSLVSCVGTTSKRLLVVGWFDLPLTFSTEVKKTEQPMSTKIIKPVTLCSRIPRNLGCSPGAELADSTLRLFTWLMDRTVAATNQGSPITEQTPSITATMKRSRWYPHPFCREQDKKQGTRGRTMLPPGLKPDLSPSQHPEQEEHELETSEDGSSLCT